MQTNFACEFSEPKNGKRKTESKKLINLNRLQTISFIFNVKQHQQQQYMILFVFKI